MWLPLDGANEDFVKSHRAIERRNLSDNLDKYIEICRQSKVRANSLSASILLQLSLARKGVAHNLICYVMF